MYSVRKNSKGHGTTYFKIALGNIVMTAVLTWQYGTDYLTIFCASSILLVIIETPMTLGGIRKGTLYVFGHKLSKIADIILRALVDGPTICVPAFFVADQFVAGNLYTGMTLGILVVGLGSIYVGISDRRDLNRLTTDEKPMKSRRAMTSPVPIMVLTLINTSCLIFIFLIPAPYRAHAVAYIISYSLLVLLFYFINYNLGVRMIEIYDPESKEYRQPGPLFQAAAFTYDSAYEMALVLSPAYWVTYYLGLFQYASIS